MLSRVKAGPYTIHGLSVGGVYTSLHLPELHAVLDVGLAPRSFAAARHLFLSHGHVDHMGAILSLLGIRALVGAKRKLRVYVPGEIATPLEQILAIATSMQRYDLSVELIPMNPGDEVSLGSNLFVRAFRTFHPVPSLGYLFLRKVEKLRREFHGMDGQEIRQLREQGALLFDHAEHLEVAYATDTLAKVLDKYPELGTAKVLILECTFLDERKSLEGTHAGCHIHLDELIERHEMLTNEHLVLMHFSQIYNPREVPEILARRCPAELNARIIPLLPQGTRWPG